MTRQLLSCLALFTLSLPLLVGCSGGSDDAVKAAGNTTNSFARDSDDADDEIVEGGSQSTTSCSSTSVSPTSYCLAVEANDAMLASWHRDLYNLIIPRKAHAFYGLSTTTARQIEIIQVDENLNELSSSLIPSYNISENAALGTYSINFASEPLSRIDLVARITLDNGQVLHAPLITASYEIIVNVASDYLVKQLFDQLTTQEQLDELLPCYSDGSSDLFNNIDCKNQPYAKYSAWSSLYALTQNYEIDIPSSDTIGEAFERLDNTLDFKTHIATGISQLLRAQEVFVGGTEQDIDLADPDNILDNLSSEKTYNSTLFELAFNQVAPDSANPDASISTAISTISDNSETGETPSYPELRRNTANLSVATTTLSGDFPYVRTSLVQTADRAIELQTAPTNSLTASTSRTNLTTQGFYLAGKVPFQTITDKTDTTGIGWQLDPYVHLLYSPAADEGTPDSLMSSYVSNGSNYIITSTGGAKWDRQTKLEEQNLFSWTAHNELTEDNFSTSTIETKRYGVISFSVKLSETGSILRSIGSTSAWLAFDESTIDENQPNLSIGSEQHYQTYSFYRDTSQTLTVNAIAVDNTIATRVYEAITTTRSDPDNGQISPLQGRLSISEKNNNDEKSVATATPNGDMLTVTLDETDAGQGLIQALELRSDQPDLTGERYKLEGNSLGAIGINNQLINYSGSLIEITDGSSATLSLNRIESTHDTNTQTVSQLTQLDSIDNLVGSYAVDNEGRILFSFTVDGKDLVFKGFVSAAADDADANTPGNLMTLLMIQGYDASSSTEATIGLLYGFREQSLPIWDDTL